MPNDLMYSESRRSYWNEYDSKFQINDGLEQDIIRCLRYIEDDYRYAPGLILSEDDLKLRIIQRLNDLPPFRRLYRAADGIRTAMIHSEVPWFDADGKLTIRPDITIIDPSNTYIENGEEKGARLPAKEFRSYGHSVAFEIKFSKNRLGLTRQFLKGVRSDYLKMQGIVDRLGSEGVAHEFLGVLVVFQKYRGSCSELEDLRREVELQPRVRMFCASADRFAQPRNRSIR